MGHRLGYLLMSLWESRVGCLMQLTSPRTSSSPGRQESSEESTKLPEKLLQYALQAVGVSGGRRSATLLEYPSSGRY